MKKIVSTKPLRTALWTTLLVTLIGVSACSSEQQETDIESGDAMAVEQNDGATVLADANNPEAETMAMEETAPMATNDTSMATETDMTTGTDMAATDGDTSAATDMSDSTDSATTDKPVTDTADNANPNLDKTAADGLQ